MQTQSTRVTRKTVTISTKTITAKKPPARKPVAKPAPKKAIPEKLDARALGALRGYKKAHDYIVFVTTYPGSHGKKLLDLMTMDLDDSPASQGFRAAFYAEIERVLTV